MRVCFFIWALRAAGAERVLTTLANAWAARGWEVVVVTMEDGSEPPFYPLDPRIQVRPQDLLKDSTSPLSGVLNNLHRLRVLRRTFRDVKPDVIVSFIDKANALAVIATLGTGIPVIVSERTDPSRRSLGALWERLRAFAYPRARRIVFQSTGVKDWFPESVRAKGVVIPNPVPPPPPPDGPLNPDPRRILAIGRLHPVKGFDVLIEAFARAIARVPGWRLDIHGEGDARAELEARIASAGLAGQIRLPGLTDRPYDEMRRSAIFVMSSRVEGFPNALVEAMACGLPVVSTEFGGAARDILTHDQDGLLVPSEDPAALADALVRLMSDPDLRTRLGAAAAGVIERYAPERVMAQWESTLHAAVGRG